MGQQRTHRISLHPNLRGQSRPLQNQHLVPHNNQPPHRYRLLPDHPAFKPRLNRTHLIHCPLLVLMGTLGHCSGMIVPSTITAYSLSLISQLSIVNQAHCLIPTQMFAWMRPRWFVRQAHLWHQQKNHQLTQPTYQQDRHCWCLLRIQNSLLRRWHNLLMAKMEPAILCWIRVIRHRNQLLTKIVAVLPTIQIIPVTTQIQCHLGLIIPTIGAVTVVAVLAAMAVAVPVPVPTAPPLTAAAAVSARLVVVVPQIHCHHQTLHLEVVLLLQ